MVSLLDSARVAPAAIDTLLLSERALPPATVSVPAVRVVAPEKLLAAPLRVRLPAPALVSAPLPATTLTMDAVSPEPLLKVWVVPPARVMVPPVRVRPLT